MSFQKQVYNPIAPGVEGGRASNNPTSTVVAGEGQLVAGTGGVRVGAFAWNLAGVARNQCLTGLAPDGFVANEQQALITTYLGETSLLVPAGSEVTEYDRGDFWAKSLYNDAALGNKIFANLFTGRILPAAAGSFPVDLAGASGVVSASFATNVMTVTTTTIFIAPGAKVSGAGIPEETYIEAQLTGSAGSTGTYSLSRYPGTVTTSDAVVITAPDGIGGASASSATAATGSVTLTVITLTNGVLAPGQLISGTNIPAGTYIAALGTSTGGTGTLTMSAASTDTITTAAVLFSAWKETPFSVKQAGNVGELIKIGIKN